MKRIVEKDLRIMCCKFKRQASWESLGLFLSMIGDLGNDGLLCNYDWRLCKSIALYNTLMHRHSADRAWMFCGSLCDNSSEFVGFVQVTCDVYHINIPQCCHFVAYPDIHIL